MLEKLARALDGVHAPADRDAFCLRLPVNPPSTGERISFIRSI